MVSVFGGPADRKSYGDTDDFVAARVPTPNYSTEQKAIFALYQNIRDYRRSRPEWSDSTTMALFDKCLNEANDKWLLFVELLEIALMSKLSPVLTKKIETHLQTIKSNNEKLTSVIDDGVRLAYA